MTETTESLEWTAAVTSVRDAVQSGVHISQMTVSGQTFTFRDLDQMRRWVDWAEAKAQAAGTGGGFFSLARLTGR